MSIEITCIECGARNRVNDRLAGRHVRCPQCDQVVPVPPFTDATDQDPSVADDNDSGLNVEAAMSAEHLPTDESEPAPTFAAVAPSDAPPSLGPGADSADDHTSMAPSPGPRRDDKSRDPAPATTLDRDAGDIDDRVDMVLRRLRPDEEESDMTPMVDVTFLLLIFFMVTAAFSLQKAIEMPRQQSETPSSVVEDRELVDRETVEVQIDEYGSFLVLAPGFVRETPGKQNLITALRDAIDGSTDAMRLHVKVHELAKLRSFVDATDAGTITGYSELVVTQVEQFD